MTIPRDPWLRFWPKVEFTGFCWLWTASTSHGYGCFFPRTGVNQPAHRWAYEALVGPIPEGLQLDHLCRMPACVNPDHLEPVTYEENKRRGRHGVLRTRCKRSHELTEANVYTRPGTKMRRCRECKRIEDRKETRPVLQEAS